MQRNAALPSLRNVEWNPEQEDVLSLPESCQNNNISAELPDLIEKQRTVDFSLFLP